MQRFESVDLRPLESAKSIAADATREYCNTDAILNENGLGLMTRMMSVAAAPGQAEVARLEPGTSLEL